MTSIRKQRARIYRIHQTTLCRRKCGILEDQLWDRMPAVGREFGSPDFDRLMEEDYRLGRRAFDPAVQQAFGARSKRFVGVEVPEDLPLQLRPPL